MYCTKLHFRIFKTFIHNFHHSSVLGTHFNFEARVYSFIFFQSPIKQKIFLFLLLHMYITTHTLPAYRKYIMPAKKKLFSPPLSIRACVILQPVYCRKKSRESQRNKALGARFYNVPGKISYAYLFPLSTQFTARVYIKKNAT